jgi:hypothetical protein
VKDLDLTFNSNVFYDHFNGFILSEDKRVFNKLIARTLLYDKVKDIAGDIVECGVFKGSGIFTFLKLKRLFNPNSYKKIIGFDFFDTKKLLSSIKDDKEKKNMSNLFEYREFEHEKNFKTILEKKIKECGFDEYEYLLVEGDVIETTKKFSEDNVGFKISLLYMDLDLEEPTYETLVNLWGNVSSGGIVVFDEYGYHKWSESIGVDRFLKEKNLKIKNLNYMCPTAFLEKT